MSFNCFFAGLIGVCMVDAEGIEEASRKSRAGLGWS